MRDHPPHPLVDYSLLALLINSFDTDLPPDEV